MGTNSNTKPPKSATVTLNSNVQQQDESVAIQNRKLRVPWERQATEVPKNALPWPFPQPVRYPAEARMERQVAPSAQFGPGLEALDRHPGRTEGAECDLEVG